jgi:hypothetical protein
MLSLLLLLLVLVMLLLQVLTKICAQMRLLTSRCPPPPLRQRRWMGAMLSDLCDSPL